MHAATNQNRRIIVAITGASGALYGVALLKALQKIAGLETHLLISDAGVKTLKLEIGLERKDVEELADVVHDVHNIGASIASGSYKTEGMIIAPCSMKSLAAIAHGYADNLITRAADVVLKERRKLILMVRETPLNLIHLRNMTTVTEAGGIVFPPLPAFYQKPRDINGMVDETINRVLDLFNLSQAGGSQWLGYNEV